MCASSLVRLIRTTIVCFTFAALEIVALHTPLAFAASDKEHNVTKLSLTEVTPLAKNVGCLLLPNGKRKIVRIKKSVLGPDGYFLTAPFEKQDFKESKRKARAIRKEIKALEQQLPNATNPTGLLKKIARREKRYERAASLLTLKKQCMNPSEFPCAFASTESVGFIPGVARNFPLPLSPSCPSDTQWSVLSSPSAMSASTSGASLTIQSDMTGGPFEVLVRACLPSGMCGDPQAQSFFSCTLALNDSVSHVSEAQTTSVPLDATTSCGNPLTAEVVDPPTMGSVTDITAVALTYQVGIGTGQDSVRVRVCDPLLGSCSEPGLVTLMVDWGGDFVGNPLSLESYRALPSENERRHLIWKLGANMHELLDDAGMAMELQEFLTQRLLNEQWHPSSTRIELDTMRDGGFSFGVPSDNDWFIYGDFGLEPPSGVPSATPQLLFDPSATFDTPEKRRDGIDRFLAVAARSMHPQNHNYHWGFTWTNGLTLFRARYLNPAHAVMMHLLQAHFGTAGSTINGNQEDLKGYYLYLLEREALGNFRSLMRGTGPQGCADLPGQQLGMLCDSLSNFWLSNHENTASTPNENFAREFMEIYTLGPFDRVTGLPNYTDVNDVASATRYLSGYKEKAGNKEFTYFPARHSNEPRSMFQGLAPYYPELPIQNEALTPEQFNDHLFDKHPGIARYIAGKLFSMIVYPDPPVEIVEELADYFRSTDYDLLALLTKIAQSEAMFSPQAAGRHCVASPVQTYMKVINALQLSLTSMRWSLGGECQNSAGHYVGSQSCQVAFFEKFYGAIGDAGETLLDFPDVFGYDYCGEDQGKDGSTAWLSASNLLGRTTGFISFLNEHRRFITERNTQGVITRFHQLKSIIPVANQQQGLTADDIINFYAQRFRLDLAPEERAILLEYLTHDWNNGDPVLIEDWDPSDDSMMEEKLAGFTAIVAGMAQTNMY